MTAKLLDGKKVASLIRAKIKKEIEKLKIKPKLTVILIGDDSASQIYVKNKQKFATEVGIESEIIKLPTKTTETKLLKIIDNLNNDKSVNGILVHLPLPSHINELKVINKISPKKDVDGFTVISKGVLSIGKNTFIPCTPFGIVELLKHYKIKIEGKNTVIVGRSNIVGKPLANLLLNMDATVTVCHSKTKNLKDITNKADIFISAVGKKNLITKDHIKKGAIVIDVAILRDEKTKTWVGDLKFDEVSKKASFITPVPGGIGPMTVAHLLKNTLTAYKIQKKLNK